MYEDVVVVEPAVQSHNKRSTTLNGNSAHVSRMDIVST